ncbi:hypothetical protein [Mycolicibacterium gilvum]|uniref:Uncharacterized protein n=1 Tax=Mycolicibacterium gilvum TaxID=1804 RepID=A0A378SJX4_9MYCO|nr:hypothetical protein [Mycolicibacterium gilvum]MCV7056284.1 hypothetical protein [Mycolicibacterium gilvum]STZ41707.1 Uncharacterised protein [Mycolicibacterium gilvum]
MTTTVTPPTDELVDGRGGRWLGKRGIYRHNQPAVECVDVEDGGVAFHTMVTSVGWDPGIKGELIRWVASDGEVGYEVRINGTEEDAGTCDVAAFSIDSLGALAKVANDLRYEWEIITGVYASEGIRWSVW